MFKKSGGIVQLTKTITMIYYMYFNNTIYLFLQQIY